jgi:iron complex outermembrane receptor protein
MRLPSFRAVSPARSTVRRTFLAPCRHRGLATALATLVATTTAFAGRPAKTFAEMSIEELLNESVTSVAKKETTIFNSPAAISVVSADDIQRSGHTSLPELLRLVPGMSVARIHGNEWAITSRGFNDQYANKLLVLVDGRSVYSPMFAGVYWNAQDLVLADVDRIEVIRGPGATLWGANAVNGVINITSKSAKETQGGLVVTELGTEERPAVSVRQGGQLAPNVYYRTYAKYSDRQGFLDRPGQKGADSWATTRVGGRIDWEPAESALLTFETDYYRASVGEHFEGTSITPPFSPVQNLIHRNFGGHLLGRWTHHFSADSELSVQTFYDRFHHWDGDIAETRDTLDLDVQHRFPLGTRHDIVWGFGYRWTTDELTPSFYLSFNPARDRENFSNVFAQDEITLVPDRLTLTVGAKLDHDDNMFTDLQPSARLRWSPSEHQTVWTAVSHAVRLPSRYDRDARLNAAVFPAGKDLMMVSLLSRPDAESERLTAYEVGYRVEANQRLSFEFAAFYNVYDDLFGYVAHPVTFETEPAPAHLLFPLVFENSMSGSTYGTEVSAQWRATHRWKLVASHSWLQMRLKPDPWMNKQDPRHQFQLRSYLDVARNVQLTTAAYYVSHTSTPLDNNGHVDLPAHLRFDFGVTWAPSDSLELGIWGQNLLDPRHSEYGSFKTNTLTEIPRSVVTRITWRF